MPTLSYAMPLIELRYWNVVREMVKSLGFPATEESTSYGTPAFKVKGKLLCRLKEDGETLVMHADDRDIWLEDDPGVFFVTEHYQNYPYVLVRLKKIGKKKLRELLVQSWKEAAPAKVMGIWEEKRGHNKTS